MLRSLAAALAIACVASPVMAFQGPWNVHAQPGTIKGYAKASAGRSCLTGQTRAVLERLEARIGRVSIISTCRPGAVIAGTRRPSFHRYGMAVDFKTSRKAEAIAFLRTQPVLVMTYRNMSHVHFNTGQKGAVFGANAYGGRNVSARKRGRRR